MLGVKLCGVKLDNPTVLASGILGVSGKLLVRVAENGAGAVTFKSVSLKARSGHPNPCILALRDALVNCVGLSNPGVGNIIEEIAYVKEHSNAPVIASIFGETIEEYGAVARKISEAKPDFIEVNISCPNVDSKQFAYDARSAADVTKMVKRNTNIPVIVKLSPNVDFIGKIAKAVEDAGADAICAINTVGPKQFLEKKTGMPLLSNKSGGISGPRIKHIAIARVKEIRDAVKIPIIGTGGVTYGNDAVEMIEAGANAIGIGSAVHFRGIDVFKKVCGELKEYMIKNRYKKISDMQNET